MVFWLLLPAVLGFLLLGAHFLRAGNLLGVVGCLSLCGLLLLRQWWVRRVAQVVLVLGSIVWVGTTYEIAEKRSKTGEPWGRMAVILLVVAGVSLGAAGLLETRRLKQWYGGK